jgi:protein MpaA
MRRTVLVLLTALSSCSLVGTTVDRGPLPLIGSVPMSVEGRPLEYFVLGPEFERTVLFLATIHGDEAAGTPLLNTMMDTLAADPELLHGQRVVVIPVVNPDGLAANTRRNARNVDLNRNFPASNYKQTTTHGERPLSEPATKLIHQIVQLTKPELIVAFHQAADRIDYDGPAASIAHRMADASPFDVRRMGLREGSLGSWAGATCGIAVVTVELPRSADDLTQEEAWETYGPMVLEALR